MLSEDGNVLSVAVTVFVVCVGVIPRAPIVAVTIHRLSVPEYNKVTEPLSSMYNEVPVLFTILFEAELLVLSFFRIMVFPEEL